MDFEDYLFVIVLFALVVVLILATVAAVQHLPEASDQVDSQGETDTYVVPKSSVGMCFSATGSGMCSRIGNSMNGINLSDGSIGVMP